MYHLVYFNVVEGLFVLKEGEKRKKCNSTDERISCASSRFQINRKEPYKCCWKPSSMKKAYDESHIIQSAWKNLYRLCCR